MNWNSRIVFSVSDRNTERNQQKQSLVYTVKMS